MSILNIFPWKAIAGFMPTVMELVRDARKSDSALTDLQVKIERLERQQKLLAGYARMIIIGGCVILLVAVAALVIGIICLSRGY